MTELIILSHREATQVMESSPNEYDIIFITSPKDKGDYAEKIHEFSREICELLFDDTCVSHHGEIPPVESQIQEALDFAQGKSRLIVSCRAGISRSSGTAYVIKAAEVGPKEALGILAEGRHFPNDLVIEHGSKLLNNSEMCGIIGEWKWKRLAF